jgi:3-phosphoshikimate 1-carboxyvinyltransferase
VAHRAIIASSFADGQTVLSGAPLSKSVLSTIGICSQLGADIAFEKGTIDIIGGGEASIPRRLDCQESNTALKLFMGICSHFPVEVEFTGAGRLLERQLRPFTSYLDHLSAYTFNPSASLPLQLRGPIQSEEIVYFSQLGTQLLSGMLLGAPLRGEETGIGIEGSFADRHCLDATIGIMKKSGIDFVAEEQDFIMLLGDQGYSPLGEFSIPASKRLSSYLLLAGALAGKCTLEGVPESPQLAAMLSHFGAFSKSGEGSFTAGAGVLEAADVDAVQSGELLCHALVLSCLAKGDSRVLGFARLPPSQRTRARRLAGMLSRMGASITEIPEGLLVRGGKLKGAEVDSEGDPHVAMCCAAAALCAEGPTTINGAECIDRAYPDFFRDLVSLGAIVR